MNRLFILCCLIIAVTAQYGGRSAGGLLGHQQRLKFEVIGLSRGEEEEHHGGGGGGEEGGEEGGLELGGGGGGDEGGEGGGGGGGDEGGHEESIGFGGSHFQTPVDIHHEKAIHIKAKPEYHYDYHVADHKHKDYKSKHETREGYKVKGSYSLLEPDHKTIRIVDYVSDKKLGFVAKVSRVKHV